MKKRQRNRRPSDSPIGEAPNVPGGQGFTQHKGGLALHEECYSIYSSTVDAIEEYVFVTDERLNLMFVNRSFRRRLEDAGVTLDRMGMNLFRSLPCLPKASRKQYERVRRRRLPVVSEDTLLLDGERRIVRTSRVPVMSRGKITRIVTIMRDLTDQRRLEREIINVSTLERQRIGKDLHDSLGQHLTGISFLVEALRRDLVDHAHPGARSASQIAALSTLALTQTRNIVHGLSPLRLIEGGLPGALRSLCAHVHATYGIACHCQIRAGNRVQDEDTATHLYYIGQEAIHNAVRHGAPSKIVLRLSAEGSHVLLRVEDNGRGLPPGWDRRAGLGISTMRYRAAVVSGILDVGNRKRGGTRVSCRLPISGNMQRGAAAEGLLPRQRSGRKKRARIA